MRYARQPVATLRIHSIRRIRRILSVAMCAIVLFSTGVFAVGVVFAGDAEDRAEMQKKLNQGVMEQPFSVEDTANRRVHQGRYAKGFETAAETSQLVEVWIYLRRLA